MREHEVPTHVQAEDRVLLWFSFPQLVAMTMVAALAYGAYRYAPFGSTEVRIGLAVVLGLMGVAMIVGKIGGRRLPLVLADLLKYRLGNRRYAGTPAQLVRPEAPTPSQSKPGSLALLAKRARRIAHRRNGRMPFVPLGLLGKGRRRPAKDRGVKPKRRSRKGKRNKDWRSWLTVLAIAAVAAVGAVPLIALADDHHPDGLGFEITEPVPGRRVFIEGLQVTGNSAIVTVRAAADIDLWARAYRGDVLVHRETSWLEEGERKSYILPLSGDAPSLTFSWRDRLRQKGAVTLEGAEIPHPLPSAEGVLCDLTVSSLGWSPGFIVGAVESECEDSLDEVVSLPIVSGHETVTLDVAEDADVKGITGTVTATAGGSSSTTALVPDATTSFRVEVPVGKTIHGVNIEVQAEATLEIDIPPLVTLTHHPERNERITRTVSLYRPGASRTVSKTVDLSHPDGTTTQHVISATLSVPGAYVSRNVTVTVTHEEHVRAEVTERAPVTRTRSESLGMTSGVGADDPYEVLRIPEPEPEPEPATQTPGDLDELKKLFEILGWEWPW